MTNASAALNVDTRMMALRASASERAQAIPALERFIRSADREVTPSDEERFWNCEGAFRELVTSSFLSDLVNHELAKFLADPLYVSPANASQIIVVESDAYKLNVDVVDCATMPESDRLQSLPAHSMFAVKVAPLTVARYEQPQPFPADDFRRDAPIRLVDVKKQSVDTIVRLRAGYDMVVLLPEPGETVLVVSFTSKRSALGYCWTYDKVTMRAVRFLPAQPNWSRLDYAAQIIARMGDKDCVPALVRLGREHPAHFVRWSAIQSVVRLDFEAGMQLLSAACTDPHPHVRRAAEKTLARFTELSGAGG